MHGLLLATVSLLTLGAAASPTPTLEERETPCMPAWVGTALATAFADLIGKPFNQTLALNALAPKYKDYSDSVIELIDNGCTQNGPIALGAAAFSSRAAFIKGQSGQAPIPFNIENVWPACNSVAFRWTTGSAGVGSVQPEQAVTGIVVAETEPSPGHKCQQFDGWVIKTVYSEFNSGAWLYDLGIFTPANCSTTT